MAYNQMEAILSNFLAYIIWNVYSNVNIMHLESIIVITGHKAKS